MSDSVTQTYGAEKPSYFVYREGGRSPTKAHPNRFSAMKEAKRLAEKDMGATYHVLKVRATFVNTDAAAPVMSNDDKQRLAREGMAAGSIVEVNADHHIYAGQIGYVERLGEDDDTSVYVTIAGIGRNIRFSPSSLLLKSKSGPQPDERISLGGLFGAALASAAAGRRKAAEAPAPEETVEDTSSPFGNVLSMLAGMAAASIVRSRQRPAEEAHENSPEAMASYEAARAIPLGTDVLVIAEPFGFLSPGVAYIGRLARHDENPKYVWVTMTDSDTKETEEVKVNASRIKRVDDPEMLVL